MITVGNLYHHVDDTSNLIQVLKLQTKSVIDPQCPESVEVLTIVRYIFMTGINQGCTRWLSYRAFKDTWRAC